MNEVKLSAMRTVEGDMFHWNSEPDVRAATKMRIAEEIGRKLLTNDVLDFQTELSEDGTKLIITGTVKVKPDHTPQPILRDYE